MTDPAPAQRRSLLTTWDAAMLIMGSMIGSGIFIVPREIAQQVGSPGLLLLVWALAAVLTVFGALSYGELAASMPQAGGQYVYLRQAYGPMAGFLYGWTLFGVIQTGTMAAVAVAFARFLSELVPSLQAPPLLQVGGWTLSLQQLVGIACVGLLTALNTRGLKEGKWVQNLFTVTKVGALVLLVLLALYAAIRGMGRLENFSPFWPANFSGYVVPVVAAAMVGALFSSDAWNNVTFIAGEVQRPERSLPRALLAGAGTVSLLYVLCNVAYVYLLPLEQIQDRSAPPVGVQAVTAVLGTTGASLMAVLLVLSTFGCLNGMILAGARVYQVMATQRQFLAPAARLNRRQVPGWALWAQALWTGALVLTGTYNQLITYVIFAVMLFYLLTVGAVLWLRRTQPQLPRPYRVPLYPFIPLVYLALAAVVTVFIGTENPVQALYGVAIVLVGVPVYSLFVRRQHTPQ